MGEDSNPDGGEKKNEKTKEVGSSNHTESNEDKSHNQNRCGGSKFQQSRLLPRFAKRRENLLKDDSGVTPCDKSVDLSSTYSNNTKDASLSMPPFVYAGEKPIRHSLSSHATVVTFNTPSASIGNAIVSSCSSDIHTGDQAIASTSKSNSFDHSDQYDSGIGASGQPASAASSARSSPSNHCKIITPTSSGKNANSNEVSDSDIEANSSDTSDSDVIEMISSDTPAPDDDDIIYIGEFRKGSPPQQQTISEKEVEALKKECSERHLMKKDPYALKIKKEKLEDCIKTPTRHPPENTHNGNQSDVSTSGQSELPPRFAKQRGDLDKADSVNNVIPWDMSVELTVKSSNTKDALAYPPPSVTSWEKPITHSAYSHSPVATSNTPSTSISNTILSSCSSVISTDDQMIASTSKSSSFDRSDQQDSDSSVSDQPASAASSERSSPSNDYKIITPMNSENSSEVSDLPRHRKKCGGSRFKKMRFPPRIAKQRDNLVKAVSVNNVLPWDISVDLISKISNTKDASPPSSAIHTPHSHFPVVTCNSPPSSIGNTIVRSCSSVIPTDDQVIVNASKSSSFDHSDQQDNGICVNDQPSSALSSQRSSPSNDSQIISPTSLGKNANSTEKPDLPNRKKIGGSKFTQKKFPPQIAKQRENLVKAVSINNVTPCDISVDSTSKTSNIKDASPSPPSSVTVWEKPVLHSLHSHSPVVTSNAPSSSIGNTIVSSCSSVIPADEQVVPSMSKSSSFDHSDQHDSGIGVNDQPTSVPSSLRSSPSYSCKIIALKISEKSGNSNEVSDLPQNENSSDGSTFKQSRLPPRFTKQRENLLKAVSVNNDFPCDISSNLSSKTSNTKDGLPYPPPSVTSWEKPLTHSVCSHSPVVTSNTPSTSISNTILSSCSSVISTDDQMIASTLKSSSFDRSDQQDSDSSVSDQPASAASSERSSPSNDYKITTPMNSENSSEVSDLGEQNSEMKLEFTFESCFEQLSEEKRRSSGNTGHSSKSLARSTNVSNFSTNDGVQSPTSPSVDDMILKIQSVKKVPESTIVMEHSQAFPEQDECSTTYCSFSGSSETAVSVYNNVDNSSQNKKEAEITEISFRENSLLQQSNSVLSKNIDHSVTSVKSHIQMAAQHNSMSGSHCTGPLSPELMGDFEPVAITSIESSVQVAENPAVLSSPTVLFSSSQQEEENSEMKVEFTFESCLEQLSGRKRRSSGNTGHSSKKSKSLARSMNVSKFSTNVSVQSPISPIADDMNLKIQSVKKVPESTIVMEHSQTFPEQDECSTTYCSFSGSSETAVSVYNNVDNSSQNKKEAEITEISFRENSLLQQSNSVFSKNIDHSVTSVKSHIQMAAQHSSMSGSHCTGPLSPELMGDFEPKTGICGRTSLASSVQVAKIPAAPSPPTVLFNSSQQVLGNDRPLPIIVEHPDAVHKEVENSTSYGSFSGSSETAVSVYNNIDNSSQNKKEAEITEMSFREHSLLQQSNSVLSKNVDHSVTSAKSHIQMSAQHNLMAGPHCTGPVSPPLMGGFEAMTGNYTITGLSSPVEFAGISEVRSPPTVLFNSSQQVLGNDRPLPIIVEHLDAVHKEVENSTSYGSFSGSSETAVSVYNNIDNSSQNKKEAEITEMSFREHSLLQQSNSVLSKNVDHSVTSAKSHIQMSAQHNLMAGPHCTGPVSPPLMGGFEAMTGNYTITGLSSPVEFAGISEVRSPPTVLFNSSQQSQNQSKSGRSRFGRYRLPSRFVKQRKNLVKAVSVNNVTDWDISGDLTAITSNTKDALPSPPPSVNACELPIIDSLHPHFPVVISNTPSTSIGNTIVSSCSSVIPTDDQAIASTSKPNSFDHSGQYDSAIGVNDQTASALSSQRSSSNECQVIASTSSGKNANSNEVPDLKKSSILVYAAPADKPQKDVTSSTCDALPSIGAALSYKFKDSTAETEEKALSPPILHSERKNHKVKRSSCKISKKQIKKSRHVETSSPSPSLYDCIFNYHKIPKDYNCTKCSFSCLSWQMFKTHSCSEWLKKMAACKIIVEKIPDNHYKNVNKFICPKCCSNSPKHSCDERLRTMQNCFVKLEKINFNIMQSIKVAQICNHLHQTLIFKEKKKVIKNAKICSTIQEVMQYIVEPIAKINVTFNP